MRDDGMGCGDKSFIFNRTILLASLKLQVFLPTPLVSRSYKGF
jgi:hypothetical protein